MTDIRYGLRHKPTGAFLRLDIRDNHGHDYAGEESCSLVAGAGADRGPRFEVAELGDLARVMRRDEKWYNTSRDRPSWGEVDMEDCLPVMFERSVVHDPLGGDPVSVTDRAHLVTMPAFLPTRSLGTRQNGPASIMRRAFGDAYPAFEAMGDPVLAVVDVADGKRVLPGMFLETAEGNTVQVDLVVDMPEDWPLRGPEGLASRSGGFKLVACRWERFELTEAAVPFDELPPSLDLGAFGRWP